MESLDSHGTLERETGRTAISEECAISAGRVAWKIHSEVVLLLGWGRAILLQLAHPLVACAIAEHSDFRVRRLSRLHRTLDAMLALTFGSAEDAARVTQRIGAAHERVRARLRTSAGIFPAGTEYWAGDPALLSWVHATVVDSFLRTYELYVGPLALREKDNYCLEMSRLEPLLGIPGGCLPRTLAELHEYTEQMLASGEIAVTETARGLAREILFPPLPWPCRPIAWPLYLPTIGLLPPAIQDAYGFSWDSRHEAALHFSAELVRDLLPFAPSVFRHWPSCRLSDSGAWSPLET